MHKTNAANNVANEFSNGTPPLTPGTAIDAADLNTWQRELVAVVENAGLTLNVNDDTQVLQALDIVYAQLAADNTFGGQNTFGGPTTFDELITASSGVSVGAATAEILTDGTINTDTSVTAQGTVTGVTAVTGGTLSSTGGTNGLQLKAGAVDHVYASFYARTASLSTRSAYIGYGGAADTFLTIANELSGGVVKLSGGSAATGAAPVGSLELTNGHLKLSGAAPNTTAAVTNLLTPTTLNKANAMIEIALGVPSVTAGANIASVAATPFGGGANDALRVTWVAAFASAAYVVVPSAWASSIPRYAAAVVNKTATYVDIVLYRTDTGAQIDVNDAATSAVIELVAYGVQ